MYEKILQECDNFLCIVFEKYGKFGIFKRISEDRIVGNGAKSHFSGIVAIYTAKNLDRKFLFDPESTDPVGDIGSPREYGCTAHNEIVCIEEVFIVGMKVLLKFGGIIFHGIIRTSNITCSPIFPLTFIAFHDFRIRSY